MILFFNTFVSEKLTKFDRGLLRRSRTIDIFKYSLLSLQTLYPWSKVLMYVEMDYENYTEQEGKDLYKFIEHTFANYPLVISTKRCTRQSQWMEVYRKHMEESGEPIYSIANHDHIYVCNNKTYFADVVKKFTEMFGDGLGAIYSTHFPEVVGGAMNTPLIDDTFFVLERNHPDGVQIFTSATYKKLWGDGSFEHLFLPKADWFRDISNPNTFMRPTVVPKIELFRHLDGYNHCPRSINMHTQYFSYPLEVPVGILTDEMILTLGYTSDPAHTTVDVLRNNNVYDVNGCDFKGLSRNVPYFWFEHMKERNLVEGFDENTPEALAESRRIVTEALQNFAVLFCPEPKGDLVQSNIQYIVDAYHASQPEYE